MLTHVPGDGAEPVGGAQCAPAVPEEWTAESARFLADLFAGAPGSFYFCALHPDGGLAGRGLVPDLGAADAGTWLGVVARAGAEGAAGRNCYFAACTHELRVDAEGVPAEDRRRGTAVALVALFADVDCGAEASAAVAAKAIATGHVSHVVDSGGGLHVYAALGEPVRVTSENRGELEATNYAFAAWMNRIAHGEDRRPERYDLASLLRVPATVNFPNAKKVAAGRVPGPARVRWRSEQRFGVDDFAGLRGRFPAPAPPSASSGRERGARIGDLPADLEARVLRDPRLLAYWTRDARFATLAEAAQALANRLVRHHPGDSDAQRLAILAAFFRAHGRAKPVSALRAILERAWAQAGPRRRGGALG
ncbi:MAG TPA: hypothetical protein VKW76_05255 [Candidatus Binatia bacterium]|nr:hypothetical protein [Candidatus Binatia bacterium]